MSVVYNNVFAFGHHLFRGHVGLVVLAVHLLLIGPGLFALHRIGFVLSLQRLLALAVGLFEQHKLIGLPVKPGLSQEQVPTFRKEISFNA